MKKLLLKIATLSLLISASTQSFAQKDNGSMLIEPYYGYSLGKAMWKSYEIDDATNSDFSGFGPIGLRFMFYNSDRFSHGADINFRTSSLAQDYVENNTTYTDTYDVTQLRLMYRMEFHIVQTDNIDFFTSYSVGYKNKNYDFSSTNPMQTAISASGLPLAMRLSLGLRGYLTDNVSVSFDAGIAGGSFINAGVGYFIK